MSTGSEIKVMKFDRHFQRGILKLMTVDNGFCQKCCELLEPRHFISELSWFFSTFREYYQDNGQVPTRESVTVEILKHGVDKQQLYYAELNEILNSNPDEKTIKGGMTKFVRANIFVTAAVEAASRYNRGLQDDAFDYMKEQIDALFSADFGSDPFTRFGDANSVLLAANHETSNAIKIGIKAIDDEIVGLLPGTFTVFLGASNAGKSMLGPMLAKQAAKAGKRTFVTIHEDEEIPTKIRYLACFADLPISKLMYGSHLLEPHERAQLEAADKVLKEYVTLRFMYTTESTIENVMDVCRGLMKEWPFQLYICDYGQCLTSRQFKSMSEMRHLHEHIYHMLKQLCLELKIAGAGGAQVNRTGMAMNRAGAAFLRCTDVSEAYGIIKKATNVITINRSNKDVQDNRIVFLLDKARNGKCPVAVALHSNFSNGIAYDPDKQQTVVSVDSGPAKDDDQSFGPTVSKQSYG